MKRILMAGACVWITTAILAQSSGPPPQSTGSTTKQLGMIDLSSQIDSVAGRQLRMRAVSLAPGGQLTAHSHDGRPTLEYVLRGTVIEHRNGVPVEHKSGEVVVGENGVSHWWENRGTEEVVLLPVDVFKP